MTVEVMVAAQGVADPKRFYSGLVEDREILAGDVVEYITLLFLPVKVPPRLASDFPAAAG